MLDWARLSERIDEIPRVAEGTPTAMRAQASADSDRVATAPLSLFFDSRDFDAERIAAVLAELSEMYREVGGDRLVIDHVGWLERIPAGGHV